MTNWGGREPTLSNSERGTYSGDELRGAGRCRAYLLLVVVGLALVLPIEGVTWFVLGYCAPRWGWAVSGSSAIAIVSWLWSVGRTKDPRYAQSSPGTSSSSSSAHSSPASELAKSNPHLPALDSALRKGEPSAAYR